MIVDCHTHIWPDPAALGKGAGEYLLRQAGQADLIAEPHAHLAAAACTDCSFVLGFRSRLLDAEIPNTYIADYVRQHPGKLLGLAGLDPFAPDADSALAMADEDEAFCGVTLSPAACGFHPADSRVWNVYDRCCQRGLVVMVHQGVGLSAATRIEFARPHLWDEVLREYPQLPVIIAHMGYPWLDETIALLGKHPNVYADAAGLIRRPWYAYNALVRAYQFGVADKLLFGSDFPFLTAEEAIQAAYRINEAAHGTAMPIIPRETIREMVERDTLSLLGIAPEAER